MAAIDMDAAIAAGDGTLHGAIDYWHDRALMAEAALMKAAQMGKAVTPRIGLNDDGALDEVVGYTGHLEQLTYNHWFVTIGDYAIWLHSKSKITATYEKREPVNDAPKVTVREGIR